MEGFSQKGKDCLEPNREPRKQGEASGCRGMFSVVR